MDTAIRNALVDQLLEECSEEGIEIQILQRRQYFTNVSFSTEDSLKVLKIKEKIRREAN